MRKTIACVLLALPMMATAQNPVIRDQFSADPTARVFNNKVYLYPSHDIMPPQGQRQDWFCMEDYHVFSSENLTDWTDHGVIVTQNKVPWVRKDSYSMWAPDCVERNGKYYFYFPSAPAEGRGGFAVGVAIADSPEGPFIPEPEPIKGINGIDPCVLQASDGNAYIFWGNGRCAKLKPNMKELADDNPKSTVKFGNREIEMTGVNCLEGLPNRQAEGPFAFEANGWYYLTYPYVRENTEVLGYAMSKHPMGPYEYKGIIMAEHDNGCWTNHHSIVNYQGQWYLFYHHNDFSPRDDKRRSVCIEKLFFNADGFIRRWKLMEPIAVDVRSNVIFTDTWLRAKFADELAKLPKQKKAKWYTLDSENYNMKLFRFAEKYGQQTYGSFFWCETVIDSPEEMQNVRLAVGSNGASMWWLNDEEVLMLEGDRRMVEDDGMSARLTLKKGRNVLRGAVINGPGLSDMCVRFINEQGNPVTGYQVTTSSK